MKLYAVSILIAFTSCKKGPSEKANNIELSNENLSDAEKVYSDLDQTFKATQAFDVDTVLSFTHPAVIKLMGGMDSAKALMNMAFEQMKGLNLKIEKSTYPEELTFLNGEDNEFVVVPLETIMNIGGKRIKSSNFQIGARKIGSKNWKYVDGNQLNKINLHKLFPDFPKDYQLPKSSKEVL